MVADLGEGSVGIGLPAFGGGSYDVILAATRTAAWADLPSASPFHPDAQALRWLQLPIGANARAPAYSIGGARFATGRQSIFCTEVLGDLSSQTV